MAKQVIVKDGKVMRKDGPAFPHVMATPLTSDPDDTACLCCGGTCNDCEPPSSQPLTIVMKVTGVVANACNQETCNIHNREMLTTLLGPGSPGQCCVYESDSYEVPCEEADEFDLDGCLDPPLHTNQYFYFRTYLCFTTDAHTPAGRVYFTAEIGCYTNLGQWAVLHEWGGPGGTGDIGFGPDPHPIFPDKNCAVADDLHLHTWPPAEAGATGCDPCAPEFDDETFDLIQCQSRAIINPAAGGPIVISDPDEPPPEDDEEFLIII